jgi:hypothetical protein
MNLASRPITKVGLLSAAIFASIVWAAAVTGTSAGQPLGADFYTTFWVNGSGNAINWSTCGSTQYTEGCFGGGTMTGFARACAVLAGGEHTKGDAVTGEIYVLDSGGTSKADVKLDVFKEINEVTTTTVSTTILLNQSVPLPISGGAKARCSMAANTGFIFAGMSTSPNAVRIAKTDLSVFSYGAFFPPIPVVEINADQQGYVAINYADPSGGTNTGFILIGPDGSTVEDGGGNGVIFDSRNAYLPK